MTHYDQDLKSQGRGFFLNLFIVIRICIYECFDSKLYVCDESLIE